MNENEPIQPNPSDKPEIELQPVKPRRFYPPTHDKKAHGNRYSHAQKLAIKALLESGKSPTEIERSEGIDRSTVYSVMKDSRISILATDQVNKIKNSLIGSMYGNAYRAQNAISDEKLSQSSALQLMTVAAIGIDKGRLMEGLSTENLSFRGVAASIDEDRKKLMDRLKELE